MTAKYSNKLRGQRVLVVGGTSGIGFCVAEAVVEFGATVVIASSRQAKVDAKVQQLLTSYPDSKGRVSGKTCDLSDRATLEANVVELFKFATNDGKDLLDHVVNTAGDPFNLPRFEDASIADMEKLQTVRGFGGFMLAKHAKVYVKSARSSSFTVTGGINTWKPMGPMPLVAGNGASIEGLARGAAVALSPIRANCVAPGAVITEFWDHLNPEWRERLETEYSKTLLTRSLGKPEDTAEAYLYFMRDHFVTGRTILTDGGAMLV